MMNLYKFIIPFLPIFLSLEGTIPEQKKQALEKENQEIIDYSLRMQQFYELEKDEKWRDVTQKVLASPDTSPESKEAILSNQRRIIIFKYPSDGLWVKGFMSFVPNSTYKPLLILYRWGNGNFALMNPGVIYATYGNYTVVSSTLRGGVSEGKDEFGGEDVNDMKNLMDYLPTIAEEVGFKFRPSCVFMLGPSRGGLEMFLTLARFPELQNRVNKVVALSAALDLHLFIHERPNDIKKTLQSQYGLPRGTRRSEGWIAKRDPLNTVPYLKKSLPVLIVQGTADQRVSLDQGHNMLQALKNEGHDVNYWEVPKGDHVLMNTPHIMHDIVQWLESNSPCMSIHLPDKKKASTD